MLVVCVYGLARWRPPPSSISALATGSSSPAPRGSTSAVVVRSSPCPKLPPQLRSTPTPPPQPQLASCPTCARVYARTIAGIKNELAIAGSTYRTILITVHGTESMYQVRYVPNASHVNIHCHRLLYWNPVQLRTELIRYIWIYCSINSSRGNTVRHVEWYCRISPDCQSQRGPPLGG